FPADRRFVVRESGEDSPGVRHAGDQAAAERVGNGNEHDRNAARFQLQRLRHPRAGSEDHIRSRAHELRSNRPQTRGRQRAPVFLDANIAAVDPAELLERFAKCRAACTRLRLVGKCIREVNEAWYAARLLRARRERTRRRAAEQRDELAPLHSITSSARASSWGGTSRPSAFAGLRLIPSSNFVGCSTGKSAGLAPLRILPT